MSSQKAIRGATAQCIVCGAFSAEFFVKAGDRDYSRCGICRAVFLHPDQRLSPEAEYERYCRHQNDPADHGYLRFLSKLAGPLLDKLEPFSKGLDYGCGPGPALAQMLRNAGHQMNLYDPFFFPDQKPLGDTYDFITCTETAEHFHRPAEEFARFDRMLLAGGWLGVMTCFLTEDERFVSWHYRRDPTHVVFYREATLRHVARQLGWTCEIPVKDVALLQKPR